jgi:hypothetical protein
MKTTIKKILKEDDWSWVTDSLNNYSEFEIGEPLIETNPKEKLRIYLTHAHGEENGVWSDNWINFDSRDSQSVDNFIKVIKMVKYIYNSGGDYIWNMANDYIHGGLNWTPFNPNDESRIKSELSTMEDEDEKVDLVYDWLRDEISDWGLAEWNSYYDEYAPIERWSATYFDKYGVEHKVKINL